jgi:hypothetical protein
MTTDKVIALMRVPAWITRGRKGLRDRCRFGHCAGSHRFVCRWSPLQYLRGFNLRVCLDSTARALTHVNTAGLHRDRL